MAVATVAGWFASSVIRKLIPIAFSYIEDQYAWQTGMKKELIRLEEALPHIKAVVEAIEDGHQKLTDRTPQLQAWLWQLKDAVYEADDLLDELEYLKLKEQLEAAEDHTKVRAAISSSKKGIIRFTTRLFERDPTLKRLRGVVKRLDQVATNVSMFLMLVTSKEHDSRAHREKGSLLPRSKLFGREKEREETIQWLTTNACDEHESSTRGNFSLLSIVGIGGIGKTTLAQLVYNDEKVAQYFDIRIWVCVSNTFDVKKITGNALESIIMAKPDVETLHALQRKLNDRLISKRFLLVLDDVWYDESVTKWEDLLAPFKDGQNGSKILLTTRSTSVVKVAAQVMGGKQVSVNLKGLERNEYLPLFNIYAFAGVNPDDYKRLQSIGEQIAERLGGSPLAARTMGGLLNTCLDDRHWTKILDGKIVNLKQSEDDIMPVLKLSYHHLPTHLQSCFAYCSIFPQQHKFDKYDLVQMWMAAGLIQQSPNTCETPEDTGGNYFNELVKMSFFDQFLQYGSTEWYIMHDLLHELAQSVSSGECYRVADDKVGKIPRNVRHLAIVTNDPNVLKKVGKFKDVRTLHLSFGTYGHELYEAFTKALKGLNSIRVLYIDADNIADDVEELPAEVGELLHLRYLNLGSINITWLPGSLCMLYHLQVLVFSRDLPEGMNNLISLRHIVSHPQSIERIAGIGKLTSLQELNRFGVTQEIGYKIGELKEMSELHELTIVDLKNVGSIMEANEARLNEKEYLSALRLEWNWKSFELRNNSHELDEHVFDSLQPHFNLKMLKVKGYKGSRPARWMKPECISNLENIELCGCSGWEQLPPFLAQLPFLKYLHLEEMPAVRKVGPEFCGAGKDCGFPSLEVLQFDSFGKWEEWSGVVDGQWFPRLRKLKIRNCPMLPVLPLLPLGLTELEIYNVGFEYWIRWSGGEVFGPCLHKLAIKYCLKLELLPSLPDSLAILELENVALREWEGWIGGAEARPCLREFRIQNCDLRVLPSLPLTLTELIIANVQLSKWDDWARGSAADPSLSKLHIAGCFLRILPSLPLSLTELKISHMYSMTSLPGLYCNLNNGEMGSFSSSLSKLFISFCHNLTSLAGGFLQQHDVRFTSLKYFTIDCCSNLVHFPMEVFQRLHSLEKLTVKRCPKLQSNNQGAAEGTALSISSLEIDCPSLLLTLPLRSFTCLEYVEITECMKLNSLLREMEQLLLQNQTSLKALRLSRMGSLKYLPANLQSLYSLEILNLTEARELLSLPDMPCSLKKLFICNCYKLPSLPHLQSSSLEQLSISECHQLQSLPDLPTSLQLLKLSGCHELHSLPDLQSCSLKALHILECPHLQSPSRLPDSLETLDISHNFHPK